MPLIKDLAMFLVGAAAGAVPTYVITDQYASLNVFTKMGLANDIPRLQAELTKRGYTTDMFSKLANASVWELQCLLAAHLVAEKYGLSVV